MASSGGWRCGAFSRRLKFKANIHNPHVRRNDTYESSSQSFEEGRSCKGDLEGGFKGRSCKGCLFKGRPCKGCGEAGNHHPESDGEGLVGIARDAEEAGYGAAYGSDLDDSEASEEGCTRAHRWSGCAAGSQAPCTYGP